MVWIVWEIFLWHGTTSWFNPNCNDLFPNPVFWDDDSSRGGAFHCGFFNHFIPLAFDIENTNRRRDYLVLGHCANIAILIYKYFGELPVWMRGYGEKKLRGCFSDKLYIDRKYEHRPLSRRAIRVCTDLAGMIIYLPFYLLRLLDTRYRAMAKREQGRIPFVSGYSAVFKKGTPPGTDPE